MSAPSIDINLPQIPFQYDLKKIVIDHKTLPICQTRTDESGVLNKTYTNYHNYGDHIDLTIIRYRFGSILPIVLHYHIPIST